MKKHTVSKIMLYFVLTLKTRLSYVLPSHFCHRILGLIVCHLPHGPTAYFTISDLVMRHDIPDIGNMSEAYPHLIFHNFKTRLGERVSERVRVPTVILQK